MSEEQKEHEAMALVEALDRMVSGGAIRPCVVGEDGRLREVRHVMELRQDHH